MIQRALAVAVALVACVHEASAQRPPAQLDAAAILHQLRELEVTGSVLYVAAHPDDENTRLITWLANGVRVRTGYLSLTRGDGGQNLIGPELSDALGVLRTQELLEARRIDGGEQFFTRAVDFGYSKSPEESLAKWGKDAILSDIVRVYRTFRPDIVITRFDRDGSGGHGHHTASSLLAREAIELAADANAYRDQGLTPWRVKKLYFNGSTWWRSDLAGIAKQDPEHWIGVDVGGFDPLLGLSYTEIAAKSRSLHKSQGFGTAETRGETIEYLRLDVGAGVPLFDGVDNTWARVPESGPAHETIRDAIDRYDVRTPETSLGRLAKAARALDDLARSNAPDVHLLAQRKANEARSLMLQAAGIVVEATADTRVGAVPDAPKITLSTLQRRDGFGASVFNELEISGSASRDHPLPGNGVRGSALQANRATTVTEAFQLQDPLPIDEPYWLALPKLGDLRGTPAGYSGIEPASRATLRFSSFVDFDNGDSAVRDVDLQYRWVDRVAGDRVRPFTVTPEASLRFVDPVVLVRGARAKAQIEIEALASELSGELTFALPADWSLAGKVPHVDAIARGERRIVEVEIARGSDARSGALQVSLGKSNRTLHVIDYPHILPQTWYSPAEAALVPLDVAVDAQRVGCIDGAGDDVAQALRRLGVEAEPIDPATASSADLDRCDAIVTGIRAYNTQRSLARFQTELLDWVARGGTLVVQYNTNGSDLVMSPKKMGPYPFSISRERVTVENAEPTFLVPDHPLLKSPNAISQDDFRGWVQERGLYFASELDPNYVALIAWNDPGEKPSSGALIACNHGKGRFVYTGLSLFRQLPAGVPGAYRLLANLVSRREKRP